MTGESKGLETVGKPGLRLEANYQQDPFNCLMQEAVVRH
jgi:hypothetical protein